MEKTEEQLIISILQKDEEKACESIESGANVNLLIRQTHYVDTPDGKVKALCVEQIETPLMIACRLNMHKVIFALLEHGADEKCLDNGKSLSVYKENHPSFDFVRSARLISKHRTPKLDGEQKVYTA